MPSRSDNPRVWIAADVARAIHDRQLAEHGGGTGLRDPGLLEPALAQPVNAADLAAAYAFGVAKNHPFVDGDRRTARVLARLFLALNRRRLSFSAMEAVAIVESVAAGTLSAGGLAAWFRARIDAPP